MTPLSIRYKPTQLHLKEWSLIKVTGEDRENFFQGQVTNDLNLISHNQAQLTTRLSRVGKVNSFFFIAKFSDHLLLLCPNILKEKIKSDFQKYIIMDDVELVETSLDPWLRFNSFLLNEELPTSFADLNFYGFNAKLVFEKHQSIELMNEEKLEELRILNGWPKWGIDVDENNFDHKTSSWFSFLKDDNGIPPDKRIMDKTEVVNHDPTNIQDAFKYAQSERRYYGLFYRDATKPRYDDIMRNLIKKTPQKQRSDILNAYLL